MTRFIAALMILRVEIELLHLETFGNYNSIGTPRKLYYSRVALYLKLEIVGFLSLLYNNTKSFPPLIQILIVLFGSMLY